MKKIIILISLLFSAFLCFAFSKPKIEEDDSILVEGLVRVYGNEPFTFIGIVCDSGEEYSLIGDANVISELRNTQGKKIQVKGYQDEVKKTSDDDVPVFLFETLKNGKLNVIDWKFVK